MAGVFNADNAARFAAFLRNRMAKTGVPTIAVMMPTGISAGVKSRASVSAIMRKIAPISADAGRSLR